MYSSRRREPEPLALDRLAPLLPRLDDDLMAAPAQRPGQRDRRERMPRVAERGDQEPAPAHCNTPLRRLRPRGSHRSAGRAIPCAMRRRHRRSRPPLAHSPSSSCPGATKEAMLRGIASNPDHRRRLRRPDVGRHLPDARRAPQRRPHHVAAFARAWDEYTDARRPRRATRREVAPSAPCSRRASRVDTSLDGVSIAELAAQIRAERRQRAGHVEAVHDAPSPSRSRARRRPIRIRRPRRPQDRTCSAPTER